MIHPRPVNQPVLAAVWVLLFATGVQADDGPADLTALAEAPLWPIGVRLSDEMVGEKAARKPNRPADVLIWTPEAGQRVRAIMLVPNNTDSKHFVEHAPLRAVAAKHKIGIVYMRAVDTGIEWHHSKPTETPPPAPDNMPRLLSHLADITGMSELRHAPFITFGKSSRGEFPFRMGWLFPKRVIAGITYHGETPTWPIPAYAAPQDESILYVCANGQEEWDGTWYRAVRPFLLNYRANTPWLPHQVVAHGVGHGDYVDRHGSEGWGKPVPDRTMSVLRIWDYLTLFVDKAMTLRMPNEGYPTDGPLKLRPVDPERGYLVHPRAIEELLGTRWLALRKKAGAYQNIPWPEEKHPVWDTEQGHVDPKRLIRRAVDVPGDEQQGLLWIADRELAEAWLRLHDVHDAGITVP